ncbi:MAG: DEAD/DEAH box helicase [Nitrospirota bacterium]
MDIGAFVRSLGEEKSLRLRLREHRYIEPRPANYADLPLEERLSGALRHKGIERFYTHQVEAVTRLRRGENVVAMTPAGSGKSLVYNLPVLETVLKEPEARALYIFPLKGLEQDQLGNLLELAGALGLENAGAVYDGDTSGYRRRKIRENPPSVVFTNPDMIHYAFAAYHPKWETFFRNLRYVVIDEIHTYRGVFGSNVAQIMRRLRRIAHRWGSHPRFVAASATISNPGAFARDLVGLPFSVVGESGAPRGGVHFVFAEALDSPYTAATHLFLACLEQGLRTIVFTKARKITELIYSWAVQRAPALEDAVSPYRAGFLPSERREIEERLFTGELRGVVSTSALELGVDVGELDACVLVGYPGSVSSTWQRAGRVGRRGQDSFVAMVAIQDALDQYLMRHPDAFFGKPHEAAVIDPLNNDILKAHLPCAAQEVYLREDDQVYDMKALAPTVRELVREGRLRPGKEGDIWFSGVRLPHRQVGIRSVGPTFTIYAGKERVGEVSGFRVFREAFPGAIYLHRGRQYRVEELDLGTGKVFAREVDVSYYTRVLTDEDTEVRRQYGEKRLTGFSLHEGSLSMRYRVVGYDKKGLFDGRSLGRSRLEMPEYGFDTEGIWLILAEDMVASVEAEGFDLPGTLHAFEHAAISAIPLYALCDKNDIGGLSYPLYPKFNRSAIFIYDGHEGGVGLSRHVFGLFRDWFAATGRVITECPCESGCPSCVQDPQCGSGNEPLDKWGAARLARALLESADVGAGLS